MIFLINSFSFYLSPYLIKLSPFISTGIGKFINVNNVGAISASFPCSFNSIPFLVTINGTGVLNLTSTANGIKANNLEINNSTIIVRILNTRLSVTYTTARQKIYKGNTGLKQERYQLDLMKMYRILYPVTKG